MLAVLVLRDAELAALTRNEVLALEHLLHERMSEVARTRRSGDSSLLFAIKAAEYLAPLLDELGDDDPELAADIAEFRADELEHRDTARAAGATEAAGYPLLTAAIRAGCRVAIGLSKRI